MDAPFLRAASVGPAEGGVKDCERVPPFTSSVLAFGGIGF